MTNSEFPIRETLKIKRCQFGIPDWNAYKDGFTSDCGEPAISVWKTPGQSDFFTCEKHDIEFEEALLKNE